MSRLTDRTHQSPQVRASAPLAPVDWGRIGASAPVPLAVDYHGPDAALPAADVVVLTWTTAEWSALDHVFCNSGKPRTPYETAWREDWHSYQHDAGGESGGSDSYPLWGFYRLVRVDAPGGGSVTVLLFKSDAHLAHPPWLEGLSKMVAQVAKEAAPRCIYSIGTAGGTRLDARLGDVVVTNAGHLSLRQPENAGSPDNGRTVTASTFPSTALFEPVQDKLLLDLSELATPDVLEQMVTELHREVAESAPFTAHDLVNAALDPHNLEHASILAMTGTPLLTTDYYYIADGSDAAQWAVLEMDDTVVGIAAAQAGVDFAFARNISDPLVPSTAADGSAIPAEVRDRWSGLVYEHFGFYTSGNGALATWAAIASQA